MRFGRGSDVVRMWFGRVFGSGADSLAKVKGKWFPALHVDQHFQKFPSIIVKNGSEKKGTKKHAKFFFSAGNIHHVM